MPGGEKGKLGRNKELHDMYLLTSSGSFSGHPFGPGRALPSSLRREHTSQAEAK